MQCLAYAHKYGLADSALLKDIGSAYAVAGAYHAAVPPLRKAAALRAAEGAPPDRELCVALGESLLECGEAEAARAQWVAAEALAEDDAGRALARSALAAIAARLGEGGEATLAAPALVA